MVQKKMDIVFGLIVILLELNGSAAVTHSLKYFYTASSGIPKFPEFLTVGIVDGQTISYYDSVIKKEIPKQDWMAKTQGPEYWEKLTQASIGAEQTFKANIDIVKQRFNQTGGVHVFQTTYGCEWDDETDEVTVNYQCGYDGEVFIAFDLKTETWIAPTQPAVITKLKLDHNRPFTAQTKDYLTQICPDWLKKCVNYGRNSLLRTVRPSVSLLQTSPSSPVSCHATGFYPDRTRMFWSKDGEDLHEDVDHGEILPNQDGTFQMTVDLDISSVKPEDWTRYDCVFQLYGVKDDIITKLDKTVIRTNEEKRSDMIIPVIAVVVAAFLMLIAVLGVVIYKLKTGNQDKKRGAECFSTETVSSTSSSGSEGSSGSDGSYTDSIHSNAPLIPDVKTNVQ